jgi:hypothetical protein
MEAAGSKGNTQFDIIEHFPTFLTTTMMWQEHVQINGAIWHYMSHVMFTFASLPSSNFDDLPTKEKKRSEFDQLFICSPLCICPNPERVYVERTDRYPSNALHRAFVG